MNTSTIRKIAIYVGGAVVGGLVGAVVGSLIVDQLIANENGGYFPEEIEEEEEKSEEEEEKPLIAPKASLNIKNIEKKRPVDYSSITKEEKKTDLESTKSMEQLSELARKYRQDEEIEKPIVKKERPVEKSETPYIISVDEYSDPEVNYHRSTLTYYEVDDVLADQNDGIVTDVDRTIGDDTLLKFGNQSDDKDLVYVRNDKISTDFEVIRVHKSYAEDVVGIIDKRKPKKVKKFADDE